jgi:hypothetical protein
MVPRSPTPDEFHHISMALTFEPDSAEIAGFLIMVADVPGSGVIAVVATPDGRKCWTLEPFGSHPKSCWRVISAGEEENPFGRSEEDGD